MASRVPTFPSRVSSRELGSSSTLSSGSISVPVSGGDFDSDDTKKKRRRKRFARVPGDLCLERRSCAAWGLGALIILFCFWFVSVQVPHARPGGRVDSQDAKKPGSTKSKLNNLDMPMRRRNGTLEPCLKVLPVEEIEKLSFPPQTGDETIKHLHYMNYHENELLLVDGSDSQSLVFHNNRSTNLFTGNLTGRTRSASFKIGETVAVHCGFCHEHGGFDISAPDRQFLAKCEAVVMTCIFGGGDDLYQPVGMSSASLDKVCYVAFWDNVTVQAMQERGIYPDKASRKIGHWRIVFVDNLPFSDQRKNGKVPKMLSHRLFPNAKYSVWVDSKSQFRRDPLGVFEALLWRPQATLAISQHGARDCVYEEGIAIVQKHKATPGEVAAQLGQYESEGLPRKAQIEGHKALAEASVIIREHTPRTNLFMCLWFNEVALFTARDQLSFVYVLTKLPIPNINMFPVCTRRALVNSLGHKAKAKPLL